MGIQQTEYRIEVFHNLYQACLILYLIGIVAGIFLFVRFDIREIFNTRTGRKRKKEIEKIKKRNLLPFVWGLLVLQGMTGQSVANASESSVLPENFKNIVMAEEDVYRNRIGNENERLSAVIEYGQSYDASNPSYNYKIPVDFESSDIAGKENRYEFMVVDAQGQGIEKDRPFEVNTEGIVTFNRAMREDETAYVLVTRKTEGEDDAKMLMQITVLRRKILPDADNSVFSWTKIYDGKKRDEDITVTPQVQIFKRQGSGDQPAVLPGEDVDIESIRGNIETSEKDVGIYRETQMQVHSVTLKGIHKDNYQVLIPEDKVTGTVEIQPKEYHIRIHDAEREYGTKTYVKEPELSRDAETGFIQGDTEEDFLPIKNRIIFRDDSEITSPMESYRGELSNRYIMPVIKQDDGTNRSAGNYILEDDGEDSKGRLIIRQEAVDNEKIKDYLSWDGVNLIQQQGQIWIKGDYGHTPGELFLSPKEDKPYNSIVFQENEQEYIIHSSKNEITFPLREGLIEERAVTYKLQQKNEEGNVVAETPLQKFAVKVDSAAPSVSIFSDVKVETTPVNQLLETITFGVYKNNNYFVSAGIVDTDEENTQGVGWRAWSYSVLNIGKTIQKEELTELLERENSPIRWTKAEDDTVQIPVYQGHVPEEEVDTILENKIVLIKAADHVGNTAIYASNGIVIENYQPVIASITDLKEKYGAGDVQDNKIEFHLTANDNAPISGDKEKSGIQVISYELYKGDERIEGQGKTWETPITDERCEISDVETIQGNNLKVKVTAVDRAGNRQMVTRNITVDVSKPEILWNYDESVSLKDNVYAKSPVVINAEIRETNFDEDHTWLKVSHNNQEISMKFSSGGDSNISIRKQEDTQENYKTKEYTRERVIRYQLGFAGDGDYKVRIEAVDQCGNRSEGAEENPELYFVIDQKPPTLKVSVLNESQTQSGIFNEDVILQVYGEDTGKEETYSGLNKIWYTIEASGNRSVSETRVLLEESEKEENGKGIFSDRVNVSADKYNSNNVTIQVHAQDRAGNRSESEMVRLKIDVTAPGISVDWDESFPLNERYYNKTRTATVTITERNFEPERVVFHITGTDGASAQIGEWKSSADIGTSDYAVSSCQVNFAADGAYTFTLECTDLAGNTAEYGKAEEFTIDTTPPEIEVVYDHTEAQNVRYYKKPRTAAITIKEHNFDSKGVRAVITAVQGSQEIPGPSVSGFSDSGDLHTATVCYDADGDYTFRIEYTDLAGNAAEDYGQDSFVIDLTAPEVEIFDIEDQSANNGVVAPGVRFTDINYDRRKVSVSIEGVHHGALHAEYTVSDLDHGQSIKYNDFASEERVDDFYCMTARASDLAGNTTEKSVVFTVNRYGSVYVLDGSTEKWLDVSGKTYTYTNREKYVGILEYNVDEIEESKIVVNHDGNLSVLKENVDFTIVNIQSEKGWKGYHYIIKASNFNEEGNYIITLFSKDKAKNYTSSEAFRKKDKELPLCFTVDKTAPTAVISGVQENGRYRTDVRKIAIDVKDNLALEQVSVSVGNDTQIYNAKRLRETNGIIKMKISSADEWQEISVTARDAAGNILGQTEPGDGGVPVRMKVLITPNFIVQYYMNKPVFYGTLFLSLAAVGFLALYRSVLRGFKRKLFTSSRQE